MKSLVPVVAAAAAALVLSTGCLSFQSYGSPTQGHTITEGAHRADVFVNLGEPDSIYKDGKLEVLVYKSLRGQTYLGVYRKIKRTDLIVVLDDSGTVVSAQNVEAGQGSSILYPPFPNETSPVPTTELMEAPENYKTVYGAEK